MSQVFDLLIVGGGVTGSALLYLSSTYTDIKHVGMLEKYAAPARVNSLHSNNSQTLHCGDIETNYSLEKALKVQRAARMVENYATTQPDIDHLIFRYPKMVLGVGAQECRQLRERFDALSPNYPRLRLLEPRDIARIEPAVAYAKGRMRSEEIIALGSEDENTAVNFEALARSFVRQARRCAGKQVDVEYNQRVRHIKRQGELLNRDLETIEAEETGVDDFLAFKEGLVNGETPDDSWVLEVDLAPFSRGFSSPSEERFIGRGVEYLNRRLSSKLFESQGEGDRRMLNFLSMHAYRGQALMLNDAVKSVGALRRALRNASRYT